MTNKLGTEFEKNPNSHKIQGFLKSTDTLMNTMIKLVMVDVIQFMIVPLNTVLNSVVSNIVTIVAMILLSTNVSLIGPSHLS